MGKIRFYLLLVLAIGLAAGAQASDYDIKQMQERLAAQEARMAEQDARMNDLNAKIASGIGLRNVDCDETTADNLLSIQKNAKVTIGGLVTTKYTYTGADVSSMHGNDGTPFESARRASRSQLRSGDLAITDSDIYIQIDVNDHFDAYVAVDLQNTADDYYLAKAYYVRWREICDTGFGLKVGRDSLVFSSEGYGELASYAAGGSDGLADHVDFGGFVLPGGTALTDGIIPLSNGWDVDGVVQITPYWEGLDGKLKLELSFMQSIQDDTPNANNWLYHRQNRHGVEKIRSRNYGFGTMSLRATYEPIENLIFTGGVVNYRDNGFDWDDPTPPVAPGTGYGSDYYHSKNNTAFSLAASWRPSFMDRLYLWGKWIHSNDVYHFDGMRSDVFNYGAAFDIFDGWTIFAQSDYLKTRYKFGGVNQKGTAWAFYTGLQYNLPYGVSFETGWKYENVKYTYNGRTTTKAKGNTIYGMVSFEF